MPPVPFRTELNLRWADIDANFHLRHSVFYDLCAQQRMDALQAVGLNMHVIKEQHFGPILFREDHILGREIKLDDEVYVELTLRHSSKDHGRFSFTKADETHCTTLILDGAWLETVTSFVRRTSCIARSRCLDTKTSGHSACTAEGSRGCASR